MNAVESNVLGVVAFFVLAFAALFGYGYYLSWDVARWDKKIQALCTANGGANVATRVYETARAPETKEYFGAAGPNRSFGVVERRSGETLGSEYPFVMETRITEILNDRDPSVVKYVVQIVRVSDKKILAERFGYQRSGGGIPLWDPDEIRKCPVGTQSDNLYVATFVNHPHRTMDEKK